eukprot:1142103-Pelagomonas_calceolata.AAC.5
MYRHDKCIWDGPTQAITPTTGLGAEGHEGKIAAGSDAVCNAVPGFFRSDYQPPTTLRLRLGLAGSAMTQGHRVTLKSHTHRRVRSARA